MNGGWSRQVRMGSASVSSDSTTVLSRELMTSRRVAVDYREAVTESGSVRLERKINSRSKHDSPRARWRWKRIQGVEKLIGIHRTITK